MKKFSIPYGRQEISAADIDAVKEVLQSDFLTQGPAVTEFEKTFTSFIHAQYATAVSNGTAALHLAVKALGIEKNQKVITTPITFAASANGVLYNEGKIDFADIDDNALVDLNIIEDKLKKAKKNEYAGIIPVSFGGLAVHTHELQELAHKYGVWVLEDACHAPGAYYLNDGEKVYAGSNTYTDASVFSFHPVKHIACGEGGMITSNKKDIDEKVKRYRTHGITKDPSLMDNQEEGGWYYEMVDLGFNYRITDMQCALGTSQLQKTQDSVKKRNALAEKYIKEIKGIEGLEVAQQYEEGHAYHLFVVKHAKRKALYDFLRGKGIYAQVHYIPLYKMPYYKNIGYDPADYPKANAYYDSCLSLPMFPTLKEEEFDYVIETLKNFGQ